MVTLLTRRSAEPGATTGETTQAHANQARGKDTARAAEENKGGLQKKEGEPNNTQSFYTHRQGLPTQFLQKIIFKNFRIIF